jgi:hypothetical protein
MLAMQKMNLVTQLAGRQALPAGHPSLPVGRQPIVERKFTDPSSCPKVEKYPVPSFFEYRIKPREFDPL